MVVSFTEMGKTREGMETNMKDSLPDVQFIKPTKQLAEDIKWATGDGELIGEEKGDGLEQYGVQLSVCWYVKPILKDHCQQRREEF